MIIGDLITIAVSPSTETVIRAVLAILDSIPKDNEKDILIEINGHSQQLSDTSNAIDYAICQMNDQKKQIEELRSKIENSQQFFSINDDQTVTQHVQPDAVSSEIDEICNKLNDSCNLISLTIAAMESKEEHLKELVKKAEETKESISLSREQVEEVRSQLTTILENREKKALPFNIIMNFGFCILSAVLGFVLGKFFM